MACHPVALLLGPTPCSVLVHHMEELSWYTTLTVAFLNAFRGSTRPSLTAAARWHQFCGTSRFAVASVEAGTEHTASTDSSHQTISDSALSDKPTSNNCIYWRRYVGTGRRPWSLQSVRGTRRRHNLCYLPRRPLHVALRPHRIEIDG